EVVAPANRPAQDHLERAARGVLRHACGAEDEDPQRADLQASAAAREGQLKRGQKRQGGQSDDDAEVVEPLPQKAADHLAHEGRASRKRSSKSAEERTSRTARSA